MQKLNAQAEQVLKLVTTFVEIHKKVFKSQLKEVLTAFGVKESVPYSVLAGELAEVRDSLERVIGAIEGDSEKATALREYTVALKESVDALYAICTRLAGYASGADRSFTRRDYKREVKAYNETVQSYKALGYRLNDLFGSVQ